MLTSSIVHQHYRPRFDFAKILLYHCEMRKIGKSELLRVDEFIACNKTLAEQEPGWGRLQNGRWFASWPVHDDLGAIRGSLNFRVDPKYPDYPNLSLLFDGNAVSRVDLTPDSWVKLNPPWAFGCPAAVKGNHVHTWADNRDRIFTTGKWLLQARRPVPHAVRRVPHMLRWFADHINLTLSGSQFGFDFSPNTDMFGEEASK